MTRPATLLLATLLTGAPGCREAGESPPPPAGSPDSIAPTSRDSGSFERTQHSDFRAIGQEPGWELRLLAGKEIRFIYDYGSDTVVTPLPPRQRSPETGAILYHAKADSIDLQVVIEPSRCTDAMSGQPFERTVTVVLNGQAYRGCGGR